MKKYRSNDQSRTCGEVISSDCISWAGGAVDGLCQGATLTQVMQKTIQDATGCCEGDFPPGRASCYTGDWIDISSSIPVSGSFGGVNYTLSANVQYRWERNGDLLTRGEIQLSYTPTVYTTSSFDIPMSSISIGCMPANWVARQAIMVEANAGTSNNQVIDIFTTSVLVLDYPTPSLSLNVNYVNILHTPVTVGISLDGVRFNLA